MKGIIAPVTLVVLAMLSGCTNLTGPGGEGNGSETTARGIIVDSLGVPAAGVPVRLLPEAYDPVSHDTLSAGWKTVANGRGEYRISGISAGRYSVEAGSEDAGVKALIRDIAASGKRGEVLVGTDSLRRTGAVLVNLAGKSPRNGDYLYVPGTSSFAFVTTRDSSLGRTVFSGIPSGDIADLIYVSAADSRDTDLIGDTLTLQPGDTMAMAFAAWKYKQQILLNTAASGAGIQGNVLDFPVLLRLNSDNFDFTGAQSGGEDIRFAKTDGTPLVAEIERWDAVNRQAELWVKVDTIYGNSSSQALLMYWGNPAAAYPPSRNAVFDTAYGFQGVWHLGDAVADTVRDATTNGYFGLSPDTARPQVAKGIIGRCRVFDGVADFITMPNTAGSSLNFPAEGYYTVSAWVWLDSLDNTEHLVVAKGYEQYFLRFTYFPSNSPQWEFSEFGKVNTWQACTTSAVSGKWALLTGVRKGGAQFLYLNGVLVCSTPNVYQTTSLARNTSFDLSVGKLLETVKLPNDSYGNCFYRGAIDELRIVSAARSADWVRLCYMNQRTDDRLIEFVE